MTYGQPKTDMEIALTKEIIEGRRNEAASWRLFAGILEEQRGVPMTVKALREKADMLERMADAREVRLNGSD